MYSTPHSPLGAGASLTLGLREQGCGFVLNGKLNPVDLFVGRRASTAEPWELLPFYTPHPGVPTPLPTGRFGRFVAASGDKWMIGPLVFKLCTSFPLEGEAALEDSAYAPVVCGFLEYDNTHCDDSAELIFGVGSAADPKSGPLSVGFHVSAEFGFVTAPSPEVRLVRGEDLFNQRAAPLAAHVFTVPPNAKRVFPLVLGFFQSDSFYATSVESLTDVLNAGIQQHSEYIARSDAIDAAFMRSSLAFAEKQVLADEVRAWLASSKRLRHEAPIDLGPLRTIWKRLEATT